MPWIHAADMARLCLFAAENSSLAGPVNAVAPGAVTNAQFTRALAATLHRPAFLPVPAWALHLLPGGMHEMFLQSQRISPAAALSAGFRFLHPDLPDALSDVFAR
jgi:NAD dependent epimerase/dehydratase family enzyme